LAKKYGLFKASHIKRGGICLLKKSRSNVKVGKTYKYEKKFIVSLDWQGIIW
jgi:hypothetical protein